MNSQSNSVIAKARSFLGVKESPPNSNNVIFNTVFYGHAVAGSAYAWCCVFVWYIFNVLGLTSLFYGGNKTASCTELMNWAKGHGQWVTSGYQPGDLMLYNFGDYPRTIAEHVGICEAYSGGVVTSIEGNTSTGSDSDGGEVMERKRSGSVILGAYRPEYINEEEVELTRDEIKAIVREVIDEDNPTYADLVDVPDYWQKPVKAMLDAGAINGGTPAEENPTDVNIRRETLKAAVIATMYHDAKS